MCNDTDPQSSSTRSGRRLLKVLTVVSVADRNESCIAEFRTAPSLGDIGIYVSAWYMAFQRRSSAFQGGLRIPEVDLKKTGPKDSNSGPFMYKDCVGWVSSISIREVQLNRNLKIPPWSGYTPTFCLGRQLQPLRRPTQSTTIQISCQDVKSRDTILRLTSLQHQTPVLRRSDFVPSTLQSDRRRCQDRGGMGSLIVSRL